MGSQIQNRREQRRLPRMRRYAIGGDIRYSRQKLLRRDSQRIGGRGIAVD